MDPEDFQGGYEAAVAVGNAVAELRDEWAGQIHVDRLGSQKLADGFAHQELVKRLSREYPNVAVVSEEDEEHDCSRPLDYWLIDPIDGSLSWSGGFSGFVCQIAYVRNAAVEFSTIHAPLLEMTWTALRGHGVTLNGNALPALNQGDNPEGLVRIIDNYPEPRGIAKRLVDALGTTEYIESGSIGLKAALVASARADLFVKDVVVRDWDVAPAMLMMAELGGGMLRTSGAEFLLEGSYHKADGVIFARSESLCRKVALWHSEGEPTTVR